MRLLRRAFRLTRHYSNPLAGVYHCRECHRNLTGLRALTGHHIEEHLSR